MEEIVPQMWEYSFYNVRVGGSVKHARFLSRVPPGPEVKDGYVVQPGYSVPIEDMAALTGLRISNPFFFNIAAPSPVLEKDQESPLVLALMRLMELHGRHPDDLPYIWSRIWVASKDQNFLGRQEARTRELCRYMGSKPPGVRIAKNWEVGKVSPFCLNPEMPAGSAWIKYFPADQPRSWPRASDSNNIWTYDERGTASIIPLKDVKSQCPNHP